jgi:hypothetical protein
MLSSFSSKPRDIANEGTIDAFGMGIDKPNVAVS